MSDKNDKAEERTEWAEDRTYLANERTFAAWMRTGMACVAVALGLQAIFKDFEPTWIAKAVAGVFIATGLLVFVSASRKASRTQRRLDCHSTSGQSLSTIYLMTALMCLGAMAAGVILWFI